MHNDAVVFVNPSLAFGVIYITQATLALVADDGTAQDCGACGEAVTTMSLDVINIFLCLLMMTTLSSILSFKFSFTAHPLSSTTPSSRRSDTTAMLVSWLVGEWHRHYRIDDLVSLYDINVKYLWSGDAADGTTLSRRGSPSLV